MLQKVKPLAQRPRASFGFDGSTSGDWTALKGETEDGLLFTPTYGPDDRLTIWDPGAWGGEVPRSEVAAAVAEMFDTYNVGVLFADPPLWRTEIDEWRALHGDKKVLDFQTNHITRMFTALDRFTSDLSTGALQHDGCQTTTIHVANARRMARPGQRYILGKPNQKQKIDVAIASVLAHEAAAFSRAGDWKQKAAGKYTYFV